MPDAKYRPALSWQGGLWVLRALALLLVCAAWPVLVLSVRPMLDRHTYSLLLWTLAGVSVLVLLAFRAKLPRPSHRLWMATLLIAGIVSGIVTFYLSNPSGTSFKDVVVAVGAVTSGLFFGVFGNNIVGRRELANDVKAMAAEPLRILNKQLHSLMESSLGWVRNGGHERMAAALDSYQIEARDALKALAERFDTDLPYELTLGLTEFTGSFTCPKCVSPGYAFNYVIRAGKPFAQTTCIRCCYEFQIARNGDVRAGASPLHRRSGSKILTVSTDPKGDLVPVLGCSRSHHVLVVIQTAQELVAICSPCKEMLTITPSEFRKWQKKKGRSLSNY